MVEPLPEQIRTALADLVSDGAGATTGEVLTGGVSSDIWRVDLPAGPICVKRALDRLRVAADWHAPVERNRYEARWMRVAGAAVPGSVPALLGEAGGCLAMQYLAADNHELWKTALLAGRVDAGFAGQVGERLARIHAATAADPATPALFDSAAIFLAIRLEPYLLATAAVHPDRAEALRALVAAFESNRRVAVHGDVSPKNILHGPNGPVFLDAECATWGDPAFDLAFCLTHLLLKRLAVPQAAGALAAALEALAAAYLGGVDWEAPSAVEARTARLLPGLLLARIDGKSPVEYLTQADRRRVRAAGRALLHAPVGSLADLQAAWNSAVGE